MSSPAAAVTRLRHTARRAGPVFSSEPSATLTRGYRGETAGDFLHNRRSHTWSIFDLPELEELEWPPCA